MSYVFFLRAFKLPIVAMLALIAAATIMVPLYRARLRALDRMAAQARVVQLNRNRSWLQSAFPKQGKPADVSLDDLPERRPAGPGPKDASESAAMIRAEDESPIEVDDESNEHELSDEEIAAFLRSTNPEDAIVEYPRGTEIVFDSLQHLGAGEWVSHPLNHFGPHSLVMIARTLVRWQQLSAGTNAPTPSLPPVVEAAPTASPETTTQPVAVVSPPSAPTPTTVATDAKPHIRITNPTENRYPVSFLADQRVETLQPGQALDLDVAHVVIRFDRGRQKLPPVKVELTPGEYKFRIDAQGWDLPTHP